MRILKWIDEYLIKLLKATATVLFLAILILAVLQVVFRYFLKLPSPWSEELSRLGLVWLIFLTAALGVRLKAHPYLELLVTRVPFKAKHIICVAVYLIMTIMGIVMVVYGHGYFSRTAGDYTTSLGYPRNLFYLPVPVSGALIAIYSIREVFQAVKAIITGKKEEGITI